jgi:hypothetical protein
MKQHIGDLSQRFNVLLHLSEWGSINICRFKNKISLVETERAGKLGP